MKEAIAGFRAELSMSPRWFIVIPLFLALLLFFLGEVQVPSERERLQNLALLTFLLAVAIWLLLLWQPWASGWLGIAGLIALITIAEQTLAIPGLLSLLSIPVVLATAAYGLAAGSATAGVVTLLLLLNPNRATIAPGENLVALLAIWGTAAAMIAVLFPMRHLARWAWQYYELANQRLEEARDRKAELEQALDDLAHTNVQLTRLNLLAQGLRQMAEDARTAKEEFVANVSHELRTPLNMIIGFSETILQSPQTYGDHIPPQLLADLAVIHRNAEHLSALINDVLDLGQIDADQMALTKEHVRFTEIVEDAITAVRPLLEAKGLYLVKEVEEGLPPVFCDRTRIREVLLNLLSNAGRFTDQGGIRLTVCRQSNTLLVSIADTGNGIATADLPKLFQPFQQLDRSIRRRHDGTGLGLSISKRFIELHGGQIWVESTVGIGTTFFFRLPLEVPAPLSSGSMRWLTPDWDYLQRTPVRIKPKIAITPRFVVLEQGSSLQRLLNRYWNEAEVVAVTEVEQAVAELQRVPTQALLVNAVPVSKALRHLANAPRLPNNTPAIVCSMPDASDAGAGYGASERLVKPVARQELLDALQRLDVSTGTILVVDDEPDALQLFGRMLVSAGRDYRVLQARDGQEAMHILREHRPDAILLDLVMPNLDGFQFLDLRSQDASLGVIPVVIISAQDRSGQPVVSSMLAVTQEQGLSAQRLLTGIAALSQILSPAGQVGDLTQLEMLPD